MSLLRTTPRPLMLALSATAAVLVVAAAGCAVAEPAPVCGPPQFEGIANDEVFAVLDPRDDLVADDPAAPGLLTPTEGQAFSATGDAPTLRWDDTLEASLDPDVPRAAADGVDKRLGPTRSPLDVVGSWLIPSAHAHLPPVSGGMHIARIDFEDERCPLELVTSRTTWVLDDSEWAKLIAASGQTLTLTLKSAYLTEGRVSDGPYQSAVSFRVE